MKGRCYIALCKEGELVCEVLESQLNGVEWRCIIRRIRKIRSRTIQFSLHDWPLNLVYFLYKTWADHLKQPSKRTRDKNSHSNWSTATEAQQQNNWSDLEKKPEIIQSLDSAQIVLLNAFHLTKPWRCPTSNGSTGHLRLTVKELFDMKLIKEHIANHLIDSHKKISKS